MSEIGSGSSFYTNLPKKPFLKKVNNNCVYFNGTNQHLQINHNDSLDNIVNTDFTFEVFVYIINSQNTDMPIYTTNTNGANPNFQIYVDNSNKLKVGYVNGSGDENLITLSDDILVSRYSWHHIAFTFTKNSNEFKIWLDGQNSNTGTSPTLV